MKIEYSPSEIFEGVKKNDRDIVSYVYGNCYPKIERVVRKYGGDKFDTEDILQEAMVVFYLKAKTLGFKLTCHPFTYIYSVAVNIFLDSKRKYKNRIELVQEVKNDDDVFYYDEFEIFVNSDEDNLKQNLYKEAFERLKNKCKQLLTLYYTETSVNEIMKKMDFKNENMIYQQKRRCIMKLLDMISNNPKINFLSK